MEGQINIYYDEEGDFLEISAGEPSKCYAEEVEPGVFIRFDKKTDEAKNIGILNFKKRAKNIVEIIPNLPLRVNFEKVKV